MNTSTHPQVPQSDFPARLAFFEAIVSQASKFALLAPTRKATSKHVKILLAAQQKMVEIRADFLFPESQP